MTRKGIKVNWDEVQKELDELLDERDAHGTSPELAKRIHGLQKRMAYHIKHGLNKNAWGNNIPMRVFGKRLKDMTVEERRAYARLRYYKGDTAAARVPVKE